MIFYLKVLGGQGTVFQEGSLRTPRTPVPQGGRQGAESPHPPPIPPVSLDALRADEPPLSGCFFTTFCPRRQKVAPRTPPKAFPLGHPPCCSPRPFGAKGVCCHIIPDTPPRGRSRRLSRAAHRARLTYTRKLGKHPFLFGEEPCSVAADAQRVPSANPSSSDCAPQTPPTGDLCTKLRIGGNPPPPISRAL